MSDDKKDTRKKGEGSGRKRPRLGSGLAEGAARDLESRGDRLRRLEQEAMGTTKDNDSRGRGNR